MKIKWHLHWSNTTWYGFCPDEKSWNRERRRVLKKTHTDIGDYPVTTGMTVCYRTPDSRALLTLHTDLDKDPAHLLGTISHECVHIASTAFREMHEDNPGEEIIAYSVGNIAKQLFEDYVASSRGKKLKETARGDK